MRIVRSVGVALSACALLAACGSSSKNSSTTTSTTAAADGSAPAPTTTTAKAGTITTGSKPVDVKKSLTDADFGDVITVDQYIANFDVPTKPLGFEDHDLVLVKLSIKMGGQFYSAIGSSSFRLVTADGSETTEFVNVDAVKAAMDKAKYEALPFSGATTSKPASGWVLFPVSQQNSPVLTLRYKRMPLRANGTTYPEKNFDIPIKG